MGTADLNARCCAKKMPFPAPKHQGSSPRAGLCVCAKLSGQNLSGLIGHSPPEFGAWKEKGLGSKMIILLWASPGLLVSSNSALCQPELVRLYK